MGISRSGDRIIERLIDDCGIARLMIWRPAAIAGLARVLQSSIWQSLNHQSIPQ
jgi:hypothetical protein